MQNTQKEKITQLLQIKQSNLESLYRIHLPKKRPVDAIRNLMLAKHKELPKEAINNNLILSPKLSKGTHRIIKECDTWNNHIELNTISSLRRNGQPITLGSPIASNTLHLHVKQLMKPLKDKEATYYKPHISLKSREITKRINYSFDLEKLAQPSHPIARLKPLEKEIPKTPILNLHRKIVGRNKPSALEL